MTERSDVPSESPGAISRRRQHAPQVPIGLRPAPSDDELETNILERWQGLGVVLTIFLALFLPGYWLFFEQQRGSHAAVEQRAESIERGRNIFGPTTEDSPHGAFQANCAQCHGNNAQGGVKGRTWIPPGTSKPVPYQAPSLRDVFDRYMVKSKTPLSAPNAYNLIYETIARGRAGQPMPAWGLGYGGPMNDQQIEDVINFLISIQPDTIKGLHVASGAHEGGFSRLLAFAAETENNEGPLQ
ncbi:MAG: cytochrome c [Mycobacteriales bacterium]